MPEQQAWSAVSVWHNLHSSPPSSSSSYSSLRSLSFPLPAALISFIFLGDSLFSPTLSFSLSNCYLSLVFAVTAMFTFHLSVTHLSFSLTLLLNHPSLVLPSYLFISFSVHFILCPPPHTHIVLHSLVPSFLLSASLLLQFFPCALPNSLSTLIVFKVCVCVVDKKKVNRKKKRCKEMKIEGKEKERGEGDE